MAVEPTSPGPNVATTARAPALVSLRAEAFTLQELLQPSAETCARALETTNSQGFITVQLPKSEELAVQVQMLVGVLLNCVSSSLMASLKTSTKAMTHA